MFIKIQFILQRQEKGFEVKGRVGRSFLFLCSAQDFERMQVTSNCCTLHRLTTIQLRLLKRFKIVERKDNEVKKTPFFKSFYLNIRRKKRFLDFLWVICQRSTVATKPNVIKIIATTFYCHQFTVCALSDCSEKVVNRIWQKKIRFLRNLRNRYWGKIYLRWCLFDDFIDHAMTIVCRKSKDVMSIHQHTQKTGWELFPHKFRQKAFNVEQKTKTQKSSASVEADRNDWKDN